MSKPEYEIVATIKVPIGLRALGRITRALSIEYGPGLFMEQNGQMMEFKRNLPRKAEAVTDGKAN